MIAIPSVVFGIAVVALLVSSACALYRVATGPTLADRVASLDVILVSLMAGVVLNAAKTGDTASLVITIVVAIVAFTATVAATRFIERRG